MNKKLFFWNKWDREFKAIYQFLLILTLLLIGVYFVVLYFGFDLAIDWLITTQLESKPIVLNINNIFNIPAPILTELFVVQQYFEGSILKISNTAFYVYLTIFILAFVVCLTIATYLKRITFLIYIALLVFSLFLIKLDALMLFGLKGNTSPILFSILFILLSYYFHDINKYTSLRNRLFSFLALTIVLGIIIHFFSQTNSPFLYLASNIYTLAIIITILFIFLVGYEVIYLVLIITTQDRKNTKTNNTKHFLILSFIYLLNLIFAYMKNEGHINWDIYHINAFILIIISAIIGIRGIKDRENLYQNILPFYPYIGILYLAIAIISISTIGFHILQANDLVLEVFEYTIILGHIGFGSMFLFYIIGNFISLLLKNLSIHKIAFKEDNFPYISARLGGIVIILAFFFLSNKSALNKTIAGYFISQADYYQIENKTESAILNYRYASSIKNHKSNYNLSHLQKGQKKSQKYSVISTKKNPTPYAFVNAGLNFKKNGKFFDALFTYHEGISKFPDSDQLKNNIAVLYSGSKILDSAIYYLNNISNPRLNKKTGIINKLALSVLKDVNFVQNFSSDLSIESDRLGLNANIIAKLIVQPDTIIKAAFLSPNNRTLNIISYAYLNNLGIWSYSNPNTNFLPLIESILFNPKNGFYVEQLLFLKALNSYNNGKILEAFQNISQLISTYSGDGKYAFIAGMWCLEQNSLKLVIEYLQQSIKQGNQDANVFYPLALWLDNQQDKANNFISELSDKDSIDSRIATIRKLISSHNKSVKQKISNHFLNTISLPVNNLLDEITVAKSENNTINMDRLYTLAGSLNPFFLEGIQEAVNYFNKKKEEDKAYEIIINAMEVNSYSEYLIKSYINQCFAMGLESYAETGLLKLLDILSQEEYNQYEIIFDLKKDQLQQAESKIDN